MQEKEWEVRENLIDCLEGEISIREFYHWFVPFTWEIDGSDFINMISLRFAEYTSGHWTKEDLRERFKEILDETVFD